MISEQQITWIEQRENERLTPLVLRRIDWKGLQGTDREQWQRAPAPNEWSIRQIIFHLADSEANYHIRLRKAVAEPGGMVVAYDQNLWNEALDYPGHGTDEALELFRLLRASSYRLLVQLPEKAWTNWVQHSERGKLTLDELLSGSESHVAEHIEQIETNFNESYQNKNT